VSVSQKLTWAHSVRRYVFEMIILLLVFALVDIFYLAWIESKVNQQDQLANEYHLTIKLHYLQAEKDLELLYHQIENKKPNIEINQWELQKLKSSTLFYLINAEIEAGLGLQRKINDELFNVLGVKLETQFSSFMALAPQSMDLDSVLKEMRNSIDMLQITLKQLIVMHDIVRNKKLAEVQSLETEKGVTYLVLMASLLLAALFIARRGLRAIDAIIYENQTAQEKIIYQAQFDSLTNLPNRLVSLDRLKQLIKEAKRHNNRIAVLFLDLDDFKKINDTLGHNIGDKILIETAMRLKSAVRAEDTVGRFGGDEFIVILGEINNLDVVHMIAENLIKCIKNVFNIDNRAMILTVSIGISVFPEDGDDASKLLRHADSAMYHAKKLGRNTYSFFTESMNQEASRKLELEEQIHGALRRGEFQVYYQPKVDLKTNKIIGAEALLRWQNPDLGNVEPDEFIPVAEQTGLIVAIGRFVILESLTFLAQQKQNDIDFHVAVNISPRQFVDVQLVTFIQDNIVQLGVASQQLELEITEGMLMAGYDYIDKALSRLNDLGVSLAMDDFGTGYSSLSYLQRYPFDVLKIDRSFLNDIILNPENRKLVQATINMASALGMKVVAEGVESEQQLAVLKEMSCDFAQGFYLGKPMPAEDLIALLDSKDS
jgi:diguanylate cyclase (GGDEF)-like protein